MEKDKGDKRKLKTVVLSTLFELFTIVANPFLSHQQTREAKPNQYLTVYEAKILGRGMLEDGKEDAIDTSQL